ncbi:VOC family protein [Oscillatoria laete-virens NRMC-F 0139]|nr:VOC family protein [Oscillatoria laete-virens]MDL5052968.1 VOC family protein [Oscillatoria laete-virens NRMC-F 0139]
MSKINHIPQGYHTVTPYLTVSDADKLITFLKEVFNAIPGERHERPDGKIMHAEVRIGDSMVMISDACAEMGATASHLYFYIENADAVFAKAIAAGCTEIMPVSNQFWGDRMGGVKDPWGNLLWISTHVEDVSPEELEKRAAAFATSMNQQKG